MWNFSLALNGPLKMSQLSDANDLAVCTPHSNPEGSQSSDASDSAPPTEQGEPVVGSKSFTTSAQPKLSQWSDTDHSSLTHSAHLDGPHTIPLTLDEGS